MADEENTTRRLPRWIPGFGWFWHRWADQFTQPLLFDDCLSLLQKIDALWRKLSDLIEDYNQFKDDFETWKAEVEATIDDLTDRIGDLETLTATHTSQISALETLTADHTSRITALETLTGTHTTQIAALRQELTALGNTVSSTFNLYDSTLTSMGNTISSHTTSINELSGRVTALEGQYEDLLELLESVHINPVVRLIEESSADRVLTTWFDWFKDTYGVPSASPLYNATPTRILEQVTAGCSMEAGYLGSPILRVKFPLMAVFTMTGASVDNVAQALLTDFATWTNSSGPMHPTNFIDFMLDTPYPYTVYDQYKALGGYQLFAPSTSRVLRCVMDPGGTARGEYVKQIVTGCRVSLSSESRTCRIAWTGEGVYYLIDETDTAGTYEVRLFMIIENF